MTDTKDGIPPWTYFYWDLFANTCWPFDEPVITCGRSNGHFQYEDGELSKSHCKFSLEFDKCFLTDLESKNGTFLNLKEITPATPIELSCFDIIIFGSQIIVYFDTGIFEIENREELIAKIKPNATNEDVFSAIKNKSIVFMKSHHPRMMVKKKMKRLNDKIASAYNQKEKKLSKYTQKIDELTKLETKLVNKLEMTKNNINKVQEEKDRLAAKIDPQIDVLHKDMEALEEKYEAIKD